jgi:hypothetical protein
MADIFPAMRAMPEFLPPIMETKPLSKCQTGEMIQLLWHGRTSLALSTTVNGQPGVLCLKGGEAGRPLPMCAPYEGDRVVLSYGQEFTLDVVQPSLEIGSSAFMQRRGVIIAVGGTLLLRVKSQNSSDDGFYDWRTGVTFLQEPNAEQCAMFTKWSITLGDITLLDFEAPPVGK